MVMKLMNGLNNLKTNKIMEFKSLFIVPIIGFGYFDEIINTKDSKWFIRTVIILCFKIDWYKRLE